MVFKFKKRDDALEFRRKMFHLLFGLVLLVLLYYAVIDVIFLIFILLFGIILSVASKHFRVFGVSRMLKWFERPVDLQHCPGRGAMLLMLGFILSLVLFPKNIALASIAILSVGDSVAHLVGRFGGAMPHPFNIAKMIEGTMVGTLCAFLVAMIFVDPISAFLAAFVAMLFEAVEVKVWKYSALDDNIIVPMIAGIVMLLVRRVF